MEFRHSVLYYTGKNTWDSSCLRWAFFIGLVSLTILIIFYVFPSLRIPVSWSIERINDINSLIVTLSGGYLVTYVSYFLTITIPTASKTQYKRVAISEYARNLQDNTYNFLNGICDFCANQEFIDKDNLERFLELNCYNNIKCNQYYQLKSDGRRYIKGFIEKLKSIEDKLEENLDYLYSKERLCLARLRCARMWKTMDQLFYGEGVLFNAEQYNDLLIQILNYHTLAIQLDRDVNNVKYEIIEKNIDNSIPKQPKRICSFVSIININYNH